MLITGWLLGGTVGIGTALFAVSIGYLEGGFNSWKAAGKETDTAERITAEDLAKKYDPANQL